MLVTIFRNGRFMAGYRFKRGDFRRFVGHCPPSRILMRGRIVVGSTHPTGLNHVT
jgi:hypothetical protein